jgi:hypothetical protein
LEEKSDDEVRAEFEAYRADEARMNAFATEDGRKLAQMARHYTERRLRADGLPPFGDKYEAIYKEEFTRATKLDPAALAAEVARIEAWEEGEKWNDPEFVRGELIYTKIEQEVASSTDEEEEEDYEYPEGDDWKQLYAETAAEVDVIPAGNGLR